MANAEGHEYAHVCARTCVCLCLSVSIINCVLWVHTTESESPFVLSSHQVAENGLYSLVSEEQGCEGRASRTVVGTHIRFASKG